MSIEKIERRISDAAQAEAETVVRDAQAAAGKQVETAQARNQSRFEKAESETRSDLHQQYEREVTAARASNRLKLLTRKSEILHQIFDAAVDRFVGNRGGDYRGWLAGRLRSVGDMTGALVPAADDRKLLEDLLAELKKQSRGAGLSLAAETLPVRGGFVVRGEKIDVDLSLDTHLVDLKEQLLPELAEKAFGGIKDKGGDSRG